MSIIRPKFTFYSYFCLKSSIPQTKFAADNVYIPHPASEMGFRPHFVSYDNSIIMKKRKTLPYRGNRGSGSYNSRNNDFTDFSSSSPTSDLSSKAASLSLLSPTFSSHRPPSLSAFSSSSSPFSSSPYSFSSNSTSRYLSSPFRSIPVSAPFPSPHPSYVQQPFQVSFNELTAAANALQELHEIPFGTLSKTYNTRGRSISSINTTNTTNTISSINTTNTSKSSTEVEVESQRHHSDLEISPEEIEASAAVISRTVSASTIDGTFRPYADKRLSPRMMPQSSRMTPSPTTTDSAVSSPSTRSTDSESVDPPVRYSYKGKGKNAEPGDVRHAAECMEYCNKSSTILLNENSNYSLTSNSSDEYTGEGQYEGVYVERPYEGGEEARSGGIGKQFTFRPIGGVGEVVEKTYTVEVGEEAV